MDKNAIDRVVSILANSHNTIVVTGAGISTEAGIPDFRGANGIYRKLGERKVMGYINIDAFNNAPGLFYDFYKEHFRFPPVEPSKAHFILAEMENKGRIQGVVTQNIDGLHQKAGNKRVIPIHGRADRFICRNSECRAYYDTDYVDSLEQRVPTCAKCGNILKPDVVLFGEAIQNYAEARDMIMRARTLLVIGSSLAVYPLAGFVKEFSTFLQDLIIINKGRTELDHAAIVKIEAEHTGDTLEEINRQLDIRKR